MKMIAKAGLEEFRGCLTPREYQALYWWIACNYTKKEIARLLCLSVWRIETLLRKAQDKVLQEMKLGFRDEEQTSAITKGRDQIPAYGGFIYDDYDDEQSLEIELAEGCATFVLSKLRAPCASAPLR